MLERFKEDALYLPSGVILVTGPTGSGKTTTVYGCINHINDPQTSIITAEEPVEYVIDGISQCSINPRIQLTFEETLRHIVRQDPDVIVIGEIRDTFSAEIAVQAALTGHKVLTTFHTEDSIGGLVRLLNMNIEAFLISSTVVSVLAQRLLRKVCTGLRRPLPADPARSAAPRVRLRRPGRRASFQRGQGCAQLPVHGLPRPRRHLRAADPERGHPQRHDRAQDEPGDPPHQHRGERAGHAVGGRPGQGRRAASPRSTKFCAACRGCSGRARCPSSGGCWRCEP